MIIDKIRSILKVSKPGLVAGAVSMCFYLKSCILFMLKMLKYVIKNNFFVILNGTKLSLFAHPRTAQSICGVINSVI